MSNFETALGAFESALPAEEGTAPNQPEAQGTTPVAPETAPVAPSQPEDPASKSIDISGLPEEAQVFIRAREREMQADYTRKTQEAAAQRAEAEQAMQFITALNSDPNFALQVQEHLNAQLAAAGYVSPAEEQYEGFDEYGNVVEPDPLQQEIAEIRQWKDQMQDEWLTANLSAQLDRQISTIQNQHPDWNESDMQAVIDLGFATQGDLLAAAEQYQAVQDQVLARYLSSKQSVNTPAPLPVGGAQQVQGPLKTEEQTRAAAMEIIRANLG